MNVLSPVLRDGVLARAGPDGEGVMSHARPDADPPGATEWVTLTVGGRPFTTSLATLTSAEPQSMLARSVLICDKCMVRFKDGWVRTDI